MLSYFLAREFDYLSRKDEDTSAAQKKLRKKANEAFKKVEELIQYIDSDEELAYSQNADENMTIDQPRPVLKKKREAKLASKLNDNTNSGALKSSPTSADANTNS